MSSITLTLPDSTVERLVRFAERDGVSVEELISAMVTQGIQAADAESIIQTRGSRGSKNRFLEILAGAPEVEPEENDRLPNSEQGRGDKR